MVYTIETDLVKREPTSINVDPELWREVRKMAIDKGITATEYFEEALREKLAKDKMGKEKHRPHTAQLASNLNTGGQSRCISGTNGPEKEPEYVSLTVPGQSSGVPKQGRINWGGVCRHPLIDPIIREPCHTLTTRDGYTLIPEGIRVIRCVAAGLVLLIYDPSGKTLAAARALGPAVNCG